MLVQAKSHSHKTDNFLKLKKNLYPLDSKGRMVLYESLFREDFL